MSREILSKLTETPLDNENFPFSTNKMIEVAGHQVRALRVSFVGELGWELHIPSESCVPVYLALTEAGKEFGMVNAGYRAIDSLSIEKGYLTGTRKSGWMTHLWRVAYSSHAS